MASSRGRTAALPQRPAKSTQNEARNPLDGLPGDCWPHAGFFTRSLWPHSCSACTIVTTHVELGAVANWGRDAAVQDGGQRGRSAQRRTAARGD